MTDQEYMKLQLYIEEEITNIFHEDLDVMPMRRTTSKTSPSKNNIEELADLSRLKLQKTKSLLIGSKFDN